MAHKAGHTGPYGELFELPELSGQQINWDNPSPEDMIRIQGDPNLQIEFLQNLMGGGTGPGYFADAEMEMGSFSESNYEYTTSEVNKEDEARRVLGEYLDTNNIESFMQLDEQGLRDAFSGNLISGFEGMSEFMQGQVEEGGYGYIDEMIGYFQDLQVGYNKLQGENIGIGALETELGNLQRKVTGPGGLTQQKGSMAEMLQQKIGTRRQAYVPQEKTSRYGSLTGTGGGGDPTSGYLSGVGSDVSAYGTSITGIDKSIWETLYGTDPGSIDDVYGEYKKTIDTTLAGPGGGLWWS